MVERSWQLSVEAQKDPLIRETVDAITPLVQNQNGLIIDEPENRVLAEFALDGETQKAARFRQLVRGRFFTLLPDDLKAEAVRGFTADGQWHYGMVDDDRDALFTGATAKEHVPSDPSDGLVLSGLAGSELAGMSRDLDRLGERLEPNPLRRSILLGGLGLVAAQQAWGRDRIDGMAKFVRTDGPFTDLTAVGATFHGDFQMHRRRLFNDGPRDPLGRPQPFGPTLPEAVLGAYHSVEPDILATVLKHAVLCEIDVRGLWRDVLDDWAARGPQPSFMGNFGDFGHDDGRISANGLRYWLEQPRPAAREVVLTTQVVWPGDSDTLLTATSQPDGLRLAWDRSSEHEYIDQYKREIVIANDELKDFVLALFEQSRRGAGRTGLPALKAVLDAVR